MTEEDEAFNEIERRSIAKKEAVKSSVDAKEALTKLLIESYDQGVKDALESVTQTIKPQRTWVGLTEEDRAEILSRKWWDFEDEFDVDGFLRLAEAKLKEKNT